MRCNRKFTGNVVPGLGAYDAYAIRTDANGNSGCNDATANPTTTSPGLTDTDFFPNIAAASGLEALASTQENSFTFQQQALCQSVITPCSISASAGSDISICNGESTNLTASGGTDYSWSPVTGLNDAAIASPVANPVITTTYTVTVSTSANCSQTATVTVTVNPLPTVNASSTTNTVCFGGNITLTGNGAQSYTWTGGISDGVAFSPASSAIYTVTGTDSNGCTDTSDVAITVNPLPNAQAGTNISVCAGAGTPLSAAGGTTYSWAPLTGLSDATIAGPVASPSVTTTYTVTVSSAAACNNTATVTVTVNPLPSVTSGTTTNSVCSGNSITLTGSGAQSYSWTGGANDGVAFAPSFTSTYTVTGTDANGCSNTSTVHVAVNPLPIVNAGTTAAAVCSGETVTLTGSGAQSYNWTGGISNGVAFIPSSTGTYTVTGTDANGCTGTSAVTITVNPLPNAQAGTTATICSGTATPLTASGGTSYVWAPLIGLDDNTSATPMASPTTTTTYTVSVFDGNCSASGTVTITVKPSPTAAIAVSPAITISPGGNPNTIYTGRGAQSLTLTATVGGNAVSYVWSGGAGLSCTNCLVTTATPTTTTTYTLTVTDANGCTLIRTITIYVVNLNNLCSGC